MAADESAGGLSSSFTDLMTSLAVIFILLLVALVNNKQQELSVKQEDLDAREQTIAQLRQQLEEALKKTTNLRQELLAALRGELSSLSARGVLVTEDERDPLALLVVVPEGLLEFGVDQHTIPSKGQEFLQDFTPRLAAIACAHRNDLASIVVEGHADSSGTDEHNLKLSQDRSIEVVRTSLHILQSMPAVADGDADGQSCFLDLLSASGRGRRDPFLVNGVEDRPRSRRVVFKIRVRSFEQREVIVGNVQ
jgi:chemotaxis protein MotB